MAGEVWWDGNKLEKEDIAGTGIFRQKMADLQEIAQLIAITKIIQYRLQLIGTDRYHTSLIKYLGNPRQYCINNCPTGYKSRGYVIGRS